ncbi:MAG: 5-bromo-4-chloroindolyl phosphate hydrolysis family protein [Gemmobacter sp.]
MAQRYGGRFSPQTGGGTPGTPPDPGGLHGRRPSRVGGRVNMLFLAPFAFLVTAFLQPAVGLGLDLAAFGTLILAAWLTREGELAHEAYDARQVARRPAIPRKLFGTGLTAAGVFVGAFVPTAGDWLSPLVLGLAAGALHLAAFGPDPLRDKGMAGVDRIGTERVARAVDEAERTVTAMREAILRAGDRTLTDRVDRFAITARRLFRTVENDPRDLTAARKYLSVYLTGARDATVRFADLHARSRDPQARADWLALMDDLETRFAERTEVLMQNDKTSLDVEIEVLRERLAYDGPPLGRP